MKYTKMAARGICLALALALCGCAAGEVLDSTTTSLAPTAEEAVSMVQAPTEEPVTQESLWQTHGLQEIGYRSQVCEVPGGFVSAVREIASQPGENGRPYAHWQLYFTDVSTRVCEKIEGAVVVDPAASELEFWGMETYAPRPFYAGGRVYLLLEYALYSLALDGSDVKLEYFMGYPTAEANQEYERWTVPFFTDGENLFFVKRREINAPDTIDIGEWYYDICPQELIRLHLPTGEEEVLYTTQGLLRLCAAQGDELYITEPYYETDIAQFYSGERTVLDDAGRRAAEETRGEDLVRINVQTGAAATVYTFTHDDPRGLWYSMSQSYPPLSTVRLSNEEWEGIYQFDGAANQWVHVPGTEDEMYLMLYYYDAQSGLMVATKDVGGGNDILEGEKWVLDATGTVQPYVWPTVGTSMGDYESTLIPIGMVGDYYVVQTDEHSRVGHLQDGIVEVDMETDPLTIAEGEEYTIVTMPVYQLILKEDFWAGNVNLLPITIL